MHAKEVAEEESEVLDELLVSRVALRVCGLEIQAQGDKGGDGGQDLSEHLDQLLVVRAGLARPAGLQTTNLCQALECHVPELGYLQEARAQRLDKRRLEDVAQRDPVAEAEKRLEGGLDQTRLCGGVQDLLAELEDLRELGAHGSLEVASLCGRHLVGRVVEHLLGEETEDDHVVLADRQTRVTSRNDFVDERGPIMRPFLLQHRDEDKVELVEKRPL